MIRLSAILVLIALLSGCGSEKDVVADGGSGYSNASLFAGQTEDEARQLLGPPDGKVISGNRTVLIYSGECLSFLDGRLEHSIPNITDRIQAGRKASRKASLLMKTKGLFTRKKSTNSDQLADSGSNNPSAPAVALPEVPISAEGAASAADSDGSDLAISGKITIVDFSADWCGPCKIVDPQLEQLARAQPDLLLRKINVGNWNSSIAKKYKLRAIPNIRVFDQNKRLIGPPTSDPGQVARYIEQARRK